MKPESDYRLGDAAQALGVEPQRLKNWLHRHKDVDLFGVRPAGGWRSFTEADLFILALAAELIKHGCPVPDAIREARIALGDVKFPNLNGLPTDLFSAETAEGWRVERDEGLLWAVGGRGPMPTVVKVSVPVLFAQVRARLGQVSAALDAEIARVDAAIKTAMAPRDGRDE